MFSAEPKHIDNYREATPKASRSMQNVSFHTFICKKCKKEKPVAGRKSLGWKAGFSCRDCC